MTRYVIIGAGAVGASLAAQFQSVGVDYALVGRGEQIRHIRTHGLTYQRPSGTQTVKLNAYDTQEPPALTTNDVLILAVKAQDVETATAFWSRQALKDSPETAGFRLPLVTLQNGLAAEAVASRRFAHVYGASILTPARFTEVGTVVAGGSPQVGAVVLGVYPSGENETARKIGADLAQANYLTEVRSDVRRWKAAKLVYNVKNVLEIFSGEPDAVSVFADRLSQEATSVLKAAAYDIADASERRVSLAGWGAAPDSGIKPGQQSTWQSFVRGVPNEVDYLNGEIVQLGRIHNVETPYNSAVQEAAARLALAGGQPGSITLDDIEVIIDRVARAA
ncbi:ketopantoate reductase family protein [Ochrobactrum teleogrylli]|uniref:ketopantoate reductase family protein n=1 Tax=Ochrobactrum teleogrylli TaxID=2479765 RepID=UPI00384FE2FB